MTTLPAPAPFPYFTDTSGTALDGGKIYIGTAGLDPRTNPIAVYQDAANMIAWAQPLRTVSGYPAYQGAASNFYPSAGDYSIIVTDRRGAVISRNLNADSLAGGAGAGMIGANDGASGTLWTTVQGFINKLLSSAGSAIVGFIQAGTGAVFRTAQSKVRDTVSVKDFGAIGDGTANDTTPIQNAINYLNSIGGGDLYFPAGNYKANLTLLSNVTLVGVSSRSSMIKPFTTGNVITVSTTSSTVRIGLRNIGIEGNIADATCNGLNLVPVAAGTFVNDINLENVYIWNCGNAGLYAAGTNSAGPFVQLLYCKNVEIHLNKQRNVVLHGAVYETTFIHGAVGPFTQTDGTGRNVSLEFDATANTNPGRVRFYGVIMNALPATTSSDFYPSIWIGAGSELGFYDCDFEEAQPSIYTENFSLIQGINITNCRFAYTASTTRAIWLKSVKSLVVKNCAFSCAGTLTNAVYFDASSSMSNITHFEITPNFYASSVSVPFADAASYYQLTDGSNNIKFYRDYMIVAGAGFAPANLNNIVDEYNHTNGFVEGTTITLAPFSTTSTVTVTNGGNISLSGGASFALAALRNTLTLRWNIQQNKWIEVGRSA